MYIPGRRILWLCCSVLHGPTDWLRLTLRTPKSFPTCILTCQAGAITGFVAAFSEGPIDFYKSQVQVQIIRAKANPDYKGAYWYQVQGLGLAQGGVDTRYSSRLYAPRTNQVQG